VDMHFHAEAAADVRREDTYVLLGEAQLVGVHSAHLMRYLSRLVDRQLALARIEGRDDRARLERHAGVAGKRDDALHRLGAASDVAARDGVLESQVFSAR